MIKNYAIPISDYGMRNPLKFMTMANHAQAANRAGNRFADQSDVVVYGIVISSYRAVSDIRRFNIQL